MATSSGAEVRPGSSSGWQGPHAPEGSWRAPRTTTFSTLLRLPSISSRCPRKSGPTKRIFASASLHLEVLGAVPVQEGDPTLLREPGGDQPLRHAARTRVHIRPRDHDHAVGDYGPVALPAGMLPDDTSQRPGHGAPPREPRVYGEVTI